MIPVEFLWLTLIAVWGFIGSARGLAKELGTSVVLMLSLFSLYMAWELLISKFVGGVSSLGSPAMASLVILGGTTGGSEWSAGTAAVIEAFYYTVAVIAVAYIAYEGIVLAFPISQGKGLGKGFFGYFGGLLNGYLIIGTIWDVVARADYFQYKLAVVSCCLSDLHNAVVQWLPITLMDRTSPFILLVPGMILLLLIILK
jgi:hypothetical protein